MGIVKFKSATLNVVSMSRPIDKAARLIKGLVGNQYVIHTEYNYEHKDWYVGIDSKNECFYDEVYPDECVIKRRGESPIAKTKGFLGELLKLTGNHEISHIDTKKTIKIKPKVLRVLYISEINQQMAAGIKGFLGNGYKASVVYSNHLPVYIVVGDSSGILMFVWKGAYLLKGRSGHFMSMDEDMYWTIRGRRLE